MKRKRPFMKRKRSRLYEALLLILLILAIIAVALLMDGRF
jgi:hypothetical protein